MISEANSVDKRLIFIHLQEIEDSLEEKWDLPLDRIKDVMKLGSIILMTKINETGVIGRKDIVLEIRKVNI